jgi:quercetin dioxygenase-like cupin family protein
MLLAGGNSMAIIVLEPGETFQHSHPITTYTEVIEGSVVFSMDGVRDKALAPRERVPVPANVAHTMTNVGAGLAKVGCGEH